MNIHVDTLEYANVLVKSGMERAQAEAVAKLQAQTVKDLIDHELVTKDDLEASQIRLEARLREEIKSEGAKLRQEITGEAAKLREEIKDATAAGDRRIDAVILQIRALQMGGANAAFAIGAIVLLSRLIR